MTSDLYFHNLEIGTPFITKIVEGGNSCVSKGYLPDGTVIAIKKYKGSPKRITQMLNYELSAIKFLTEIGIRNIPEILEPRPDLGIIVFRWIDGSPPQANHSSMSAIIKLCKSFKEIYHLNLFHKNAIDAAFSPTDIIKQISKRIELFQNTYSSYQVKNSCEQISSRLILCKSYSNLTSTFSRRTLSISDLGTHNMIWYRGNFNFIDFEFFGIDSVVKVVGDFLLHPKNKFEPDEITWFVKSMCEIFDWDSSELTVALPLLVLKWSVIAYGRTLKEIELDTKNKFFDYSIKNSKGSIYLEYFDSLQYFNERDEIKTFCSFEARG